MKVFVHIGTHKTGTSAIQSFLSKKSKEILSKHNVLYVESGRDVNSKYMHAGHHRLAWSIVEKFSERGDDNVDKDIWKSVKREIKKERPKKAIISSEFFWPAEKKEIRKIKKVLKSNQVKIVIYVRNHLDMAKSMYKQVVKKENYCKSIKKLVKENKFYFEYRKAINRWEKVFGKENVIVKIYEKEKKDIVKSFAKIIGIEKERKEKSLLNVSPDECLTHFIRAINIGEHAVPSCCEPILHRVRRNIVSQRQPGKTLSKLIKPFFSSKIMSSSERDWFKRQIREEHDKFVEEYVQPEDQHIFKI